MTGPGIKYFNGLRGLPVAVFISDPEIPEPAAVNLDQGKDRFRLESVLDRDVFISIRLFKVNFEIFTFHKPSKRLKADGPAKFLFQPVVVILDGSGFAGNKNKSRGQWITGAFDHFYKPYLDGFIQGPGTAAAFSTLHHPFTSQEQRPGNDAGFPVLVLVIFFSPSPGRSGLVHDFFMEQQIKPVVNAQITCVFLVIHHQSPLTESFL